MDLSQIKLICTRHGIRPQKSKGQNFLFDQNIVKKIIAAAAIDKKDTVLEVGPGLGVLTGELIGVAGRLVAVELDQKLADFLQAEFFDHQNFELVTEDILKINPEKIGLNNFGYKIVSNLPYSITARFLRIFLEQKIKPTQMILMLQKEVAERLSAQPGQMSLLALSAQFYSEPEILFLVSPSSFWPAPEVYSAVVRLKLKEKLPKIDEKKLFRLARMGFASKRKQLQNNLSAGLHLKNEEVKNILISLGFDEKIRAQDLGVDDWIKLAEKFLIK